MTTENEPFIPQIPELDFSEGTEMITDFSREAQRHLISARNSLLILETVPTDKEAIENVFKTFHTIKGLADFLKLKDICALTSEAEVILDMSRKGQIPFDGLLLRLTIDAIDSLQNLLELLDEQISADGKLTRPYLDISKLVKSLHQVSRKKASAKLPLHPVKIIPAINFEPDMSACTQIERKLSAGDFAVDANMLQKLVDDFKKTSKELKETQSKLHERQRELIRERELAIKLTQQAQEEARAKSEYLANMSHEIRTLINAILGFTELLRDGVLGDRQKEHVNTIVMSGKMLLGIVNDILDYSKVEAGKLKLESIDFNLTQITEDVFKMIRTRLSSKPINLNFDIAEDVPRNLVGDPTRIKQIFINLIDNAIKFTEKGEIGLTIRLEQKAGETDAKNVIQFTVKDTGIGIPQDKRKAVFESFTQASDSTTRLYGGTGLGLALCKNFVEKMGGKIWIESEVGKGSLFVFTLKLPEGKPLDDKRKIAPLGKLEGTEVMLVDGHESSMKAAQAVFDILKVKISVAANSAKQAAELLLKKENERGALPALMFVDTLLPGKEGFMLAYKIRQQERYRKIKLIAVSSDVKVDGNDDFVQAGFDAFLAKPFIASEVADAILRILGEKGAGRRVAGETAKKISCEGIRILVAEDSIPNQELLKVHFESLGCVCDYVNNGQEAVEKLRTNKYNICFMDLNMPIMGGLEATRLIRQELKNNLPVVALTAAELLEEKEKCLAVGMNDYLAKPFDLEELKEKIIKCTKM